MSFFGQLDMMLQKDLISFVKEQERKEKEDGKAVLGDSITTTILRKIIDGDCKMTGCATDRDKKKIYVEYTFYSDEEENRA